jgi:BASS family bile acid:Na+ symporter
MAGSVLTAVLLPIALGVIMLGLGLSLTLADFRRVAQVPRPVVIGLVCQMGILPVVCLGIAEAFALPPALAVGLMLLAASPGGATANLFSHLARGDVALNITLTAVNSVLSLVTLPIIVSLSMTHFMGASRELPLQVDKVAQVFAIVLVPVAIGMAVRVRRPRVAAAVERPVRLLSLCFLVAVIAATMWGERARLGELLALMGPAALAFNLASMAVGYGAPRALGVERRQAIAIGMEIGIHNSMLAMTIASSPRLLGDPTMAIPAAVYSVIMFLTAGAFGVLVNRRRGAEAP